MRRGGPTERRRGAVLQPPARGCCSDPGSACSQGLRASAPVRVPCASTRLTARALIDRARVVRLDAAWAGRDGHRVLMLRVGVVIHCSRLDARNEMDFVTFDEEAIDGVALLDEVLAPGHVDPLDDLASEPVLILAACLGVPVREPSAHRPGGYRSSDSTLRSPDEVTWVPGGSRCDATSDSKCVCGVQASERPGRVVPRPL
jgi:hypothetical protein